MLPGGWMRATAWFDKIVWNNFGRPKGGPQAEPHGWGEHSASGHHTLKKTR